MRTVDLVQRKARRLREQVVETHRDGGPVAAAALVLHKLGQAGMRVVVGTAEVIVDRRYGMRTAGIVRNELALRARSEHADANYYQPISRRGFREVLAAADVDPAVTSFVDLGAGRGRALLFAADRGFRHLLGVELDPELAEQARTNVARWRAKRRDGEGRRPAFEVRTGDAATVQLPLEPLLVLVYNSFGKATLQAVVQRVLSSYDAHPRPVTICYVNPVHADVLDGSPRLRTTARTAHWLVCSVT